MESGLLLWLLAGILRVGAQPATATERPPDGLHPLITEVLFAVPTDDGTGLGDANRDGVREANGDEFIEIVNPHDEPIQLGGYTLRDSAAEGPRRFEFVFPELELEPGGCAVVFNGRGCRWEGPIGDTSRAPEAPHPYFNDAHVFTARCSSRPSLANAGDWVMLVAPDGRVVECVSWGSPRIAVPEGVPRVEHVGRVSGSSVQRTAADGQLVRHADLDSRAYSPGEPFVKAETEPEPPAGAGGW